MVLLRLLLTFRRGSFHVELYSEYKDPYLIGIAEYLSHLILILFSEGVALLLQSVRTLVFIKRDIFHLIIGGNWKCEIFCVPVGLYVLKSAA